MGSDAERLTEIGSGARPAPEIGSTPLTPREAIYLIVAQVARPHGTQGEVGCGIVTEFPEGFHRTKRVFLGPPILPGKLEAKPGVNLREYAVEQARLSTHHGRAE